MCDLENVNKESLLKDFADFIEGKSENTKIAYLRHASKFITPDSKEFNRIVAEMIRQANTSATKNQIWSSANKFAIFMHKVYHCRDFELWIERPKRNKTLPVFLTPSEVKLLLEAEKNPKYKLILKVLFTTGMRISELVNLTLDDANLIEHKIRIRKTKNYLEREVPIPTQLAKEIGNYIKKDRVGDSEYLFTSRTGKKMDRIAVWKHIKKLVNKVGIKKNVSPHTFRHTFATYLLMKGRSLREIQELLGHKSIESTMVYTHVVDEMKKESAETFDDFLY